MIQENDGPGRDLTWYFCHISLIFITFISCRCNGWNLNYTKSKKML